MNQISLNERVQSARPFVGTKIINIFIIFGWNRSSKELLHRCRILWRGMVKSGRVCCTHCEPFWPSGKRPYIGNSLSDVGSSPLRLFVLLKSCSVRTCALTLSCSFAPHDEGNFKLAHSAAHLNAESFRW